jgi:hypothetical protein
MPSGVREPQTSNLDHARRGSKCGAFMIEERSEEAGLNLQRERALAGYSLWDIWWFIGVFGAEVEHILTCNAMECLVFPFLYCWRWFVVYGCIALAWMLMLHAVLFPSHARD